MGKAALILVAAATVALVVIGGSQSESLIETTQAQADYEHQVLASDYAASGLEIAKSNLSRDFHEYRMTKKAHKFQDGAYTLTVTGPEEGPVELTVIGSAGGFTHRITATATRPGVLDALTFDGDIKNLNFLAPGSVFGLNKDADGSNRKGDVHSIRTIDAASHALVLANMIPGHFKGVGGPADAILGAPEVDLDNMEALIRAYAGPQLVELPANVALDGGLPVSSVANPVVIRTSGNVTLDKDFKGTGILFIDNGILMMNKQSQWNGLIYIVNDNSSGGGWNHVKQKAEVWGAVVIRCGPGTSEASYRVRDDAFIQYSSQSLYRLTKLIPDLFGSPRVVLADIRETKGTT